MGRPKLKNQADVLYRPAAGIKSDYEKILTKFKETDSVRYETFNKIWQEMNMSYIYAGNVADGEMWEFTEECFRIAVDMWMPPYNFQTRVGALYLLYGLYFQQITNVKMKIRITQENWKQIMDFMEEVKSQGHLDIEYVFYRLCHAQAFHFCALPTKIVPLQLKKEILGVKSPSEMDRKPEYQEAQRSIISDLLEPDAIDQLSAIQEQYHQMKCYLTGAEATQPDASLDFIESGLVQYLTKTVAGFEENRKKRFNRKMHNRRRKDSGQTTSESEADSDLDYMGSPNSRTARKSPKRYSDDEDVSILSRRQMIKERAFASTSKPKGQRRRSFTASSGDESSSPRKGGRAKRSSESEDLWSPEREALTTAQRRTASGDGNYMSMPVLVPEVPVQENVIEIKPIKKGKGRAKKSDTKTKSSKKGKKT